MRVPIFGKSNVGTAGADWLLVIYFIACFNTDNLKISGYRERKKKWKINLPCKTKRIDWNTPQFYFFVKSAKKIHSSKLLSQNIKPGLLFNTIFSLNVLYWLNIMIN